MKDRIKELIHNPEKLEALYRDDRNAFEKGFEEAYPEIENSELSNFWRIRLDYNKIPALVRKTNLTDVIVLMAACFTAAILIRMPDIFSFGISDEVFYGRNTGIIVFMGLTAYMVWSNRMLVPKKLGLVLAAFILPAVYANLLPPAVDSDSILLVYIHLPLLMWFLYGLIFIDFDVKDKIRRIEFIRYNGDLAVLMAVLVISGGILAGITIGLFEAIGVGIEDFYMKNIVMAGAVSVPVVATFIIKNYTALTNKIAPVIATIFSPLVLFTAIIYLIALTFSAGDPYTDREFLLIFNLMLIGVMAVIVFSVSEASTTKKQKFNEIILFALSVITLIIDLIALSAIFYRLGAYGITPNRLAVMGSNILILGNLALIIVALYKVNFRKAMIKEVELTIANYLPVYLAWILFVVFLFPVLFGMQ
jgi:hypothetical protein